ncbi:T9SS type A sorting domain-containing protein [Seonamhaeicola maritimus]|uniref:T9SS type A sorting domain-containing protein n=1 Tax=Seonamhaeicola maritimus TaxID=2591822 RepID=A0A5C7GIH3_9FLAO|nr:T9SS type A sorting domain-containing protein [Seonamhaeicola maritimus]TXG37404.1 T9SS type A sorting domain-containing protein [Seonamhaeicola maritimus]
MKKSLHKTIVFTFLIGVISLVNAQRILHTFERPITDPDPFYGWDSDWSTTYGVMTIDEVNDRAICTFENNGADYIRFYWRTLVPGDNILDVSNYPILAMKGERPPVYANFRLMTSGADPHHKPGTDENSMLLSGTTDVWYWDINALIGSNVELIGFNCVDTGQADPISVMNVDFIGTFASVQELTDYNNGTITLSNNDSEISENNLKLFPNPTKDVVNFENSTNEVMTINVYNITGRKLFSTTERQIDMSSLASGVYLFKIETETASAVKRVVKQ